MEYRTLGRTGFEVGAVSLGTEYLIDLSDEHVEGVIEAAVAAGINYFDLFYAQARFRDQMGRAFAPFREKVHLTAHLGASEREGQYQKTRDIDVALGYFEDYLTRFGTDYIDVLFIHNCNDAEDFEFLRKPGGFFETAARLKSEGAARAVGFSTHGVETARAGVETGDVDVLMFPVNPAGHGAPGRAELFERCAELGVGVVAMKIFAGGKLLSDDARLELDSFLTGSDAETIEKPADITSTRLISYALSQPGVSCVVPGCANTVELADCLSYLAAGSDERDFAGILGGLGRFESGECVYCNHCLPCPSQIDVAAAMRLFDLARRGVSQHLRDTWHTSGPTAADCVECGQCQERCPFDVRVIEKMREAARLFA